jgi:hypothetical protein
MKKLVKCLLAMFLFAVPCLTLFSACSTNMDIGLIRCDLNGGSFTEEYKQENNITSDNALKAANLDYYEGFSDGLPCEKDLVAPTNKVFAGWYVDKDCTPGCYLTSEIWGNFSAGIKNKTGSNVIYARWIDAGTKDIIYQVVNVEVAFKQDFITDNTTNGNMTNTTVVRFNVSEENFGDKKSSLPTEENVVYDSTNYEFNGWKVENNGHYYDFVTPSNGHIKNATHKNGSYINYNFDTENFTNFFAEGNEGIAYVLLRPKALTLKPWNEITIALGNVAGYDYEIWNEKLKTAQEAGDGLFGYTLDPKDSKNIDEKLYFANLKLEIRYDMDFEDVKELIPDIKMFDSSLEFDGWSFKIGENTFDFDKTNWNDNAKKDPRPTDEYRKITLELKTKAVTDTNG